MSVSASPPLAPPRPPDPAGPVLRVRSGAASDAGLVRRHNEDSYLARSPVFLVADGMGGHEAGDVASALALDAFRDLVGQDLVGARALAHRIDRAAVSVAGLERAGFAPGTTLTGVVLSSQSGRPCLRVVNVGDSRTYHVSESSFCQVTHDHSEVQELVDAGRLTPEQARTSGRRNVITRALGAGGGAQVYADQFLLPARAGDRFVICSDGLSNEVAATRIEAVARGVADPGQAARELVGHALASGGHDNVTVVVVDVVQALPPWEAGDMDESTVPSVSDDTIPRLPTRRAGHPAHLAPPGRSHGHQHQETEEP